MRYVFETEDAAVYRFPTHANALVMDRADAVTSEVFIAVMEPGEAPPMHVHDDTEQVFYVLEGDGLLEIEAGGEHPVTTGQVVRIPPGTHHRIHNTGKTRLRYLVVDCFPGGRPEAEPTWDSHVDAVCELNGWDRSLIGPVREE